MINLNCFRNGNGWILVYALSMDIKNVEFDKIPMISLDLDNGYTSLSLTVDSDILLRLENEVFDKLVEIGRVKEWQIY